MAGLLHEPHRVDEFVRPEGAIRQSGEFALRDKIDDFLEQLPAFVRLREHELVEIDAEVGKVIAERAQPDMGVRQKVALAEFHETAERCEQPDRKLHRLARKAVEHDRHAAACRPAHAIDKTVGARVKDMFGAERRGEIAFFNRTRGRDYPRAAPASWKPWWRSEQSS